MPDDAMTLGSLLAQAGWTMVPLYACSVAAVAVIIKKGLDFRRARVTDHAPLGLIPEDPDAEALKQLCEGLASAATPLGRVVGATAQAALRQPARAEETGHRVAVGELDRLEHGLGALSFLAQVAPLFGLLGTVLGMVELFSSMESAGDAIDTTTLSSGIWKALLTTAAGLIVAIPALGAHAWLGARLDRLRLAMDEGIGRILDGLARQT